MREEIREIPKSVKEKVSEGIAFLKLRGKSLTVVFKEEENKEEIINLFFEKQIAFRRTNNDVALSFSVVNIDQYRAIAKLIGSLDLEIE